MQTGTHKNPNRRTARAAVASILMAAIWCGLFRWQMAFFCRHFAACWFGGLAVVLAPLLADMCAPVNNPNNEKEC